MHRLILLLLVMFQPVAARAATPEEAVASIDQAMRAAEAEGFGGAVIVEHRGRTLIRRGYGLANRETRTPYTPETIGQIGSITKTFTALAISRLIAERRIDPAATVGTYLPDAPEPGRSRTINDLLTHRAGLADTCGDDFERLSARRLVEHCLALPLAHPEGGTHYSNMGYALLARIVEAVPGESWERYLARTIWRPLGMRSTGFTFPRVRSGRFAWGYRDGAASTPISQRIAPLGGEDWNLRGNSGMQASADDMMRFGRALIASNRAIPEAARRLMIVPHGPLADGVAEGYGLFFRHDAAGRVHRVGHSGSDGTFFSYLAWYPQSGTLLYFVGNGGEARILPVLRRVLRAAEGLPAS